MNKRNSIIIGILVLAIIYALWLIIPGKKDVAMTDSEKDQANDAMLAKENPKMAEKEVSEENKLMEKENASAPTDKEGAMMQKGSYEAYSPEKVALASASHDVVLFFRASWCPTCRGLDKNIKENMNSIPTELSILDVDYDNSSDLKKKYGVTYQHTLVQVDKDGNMIKKWSGSPTLSALASEVK